MMQSLKRILCILCVVFLLIPAAVTLADSAQRSETLNIGSDSMAYAIVPVSGLDTNNLALNQIPYNAQLTVKGQLLIRTGDLKAALRGTELVNVYGNALAPTDLIIENGRLLLAKPETSQGTEPAPKLATALSAFEGFALRFTASDINAYSVAMLQAQNEFQQLLSGMEPSIRDQLLQVFINATKNSSYNCFVYISVPKYMFRSGMRMVCQVLFQLRQALAILSATTDVSGALDSIEESSLMKTFRSILQDSGTDLSKVDFWRSKGWDTYTKQYLLNHQGSAEASSLKGKTVIISDGNGNALDLVIGNVWQSPVVAPVDPNAAPVIVPGSGIPREEHMEELPS